MLLELVAPANVVLAEDADAEAARHVAAVARGDGCVLVGRCAADGQHLDLLLAAPGRAPEILEAALPVAAGAVVVTALEWLQLTEGQHFLCVGFSHGGTSLFTPRGAVCLSFALAHRAVLRIRIAVAAAEEAADGQAAPFRPPARSAAAVEVRRLLLLQEGGMIGSVDFETLRSAMLGGAEAGSFRFRLFEMRSRSVTADICYLDSVPPIEDVFATEASPAIVAVGSRPFLSLHRIAPERRGARALIGSAAKGLVSYARSWNPFAGDFDPLSAPTQRSAGLMRFADIQVPSREKCLDVAMDAKFVDDTRVGDTLLPAPAVAGRLAYGATCDEFGRVSLFCLETLRCLHMWKGYRDAQVAWLPPGAAALALLIHAPRRGLLELWDVGSAESGPARLAASVVGPDCRLLVTPNAAYVLRRTGQLDRVGWSPSPAAAAAADADGGAAEDAFDSAGSEEESGAPRTAERFQSFVA